MRLATKLLPILLIGAILVGCTSRKSREEQGFLGRAWHNMNAHFNGYFNANEILAESFLILEEQHVDNYNQQLPVFPFIAAENPSAVSSELDRAIEKVAVVVNLHPYSNWTDDSYLLAGQAQFMKQDYEKAEQTFRYLVSEFRPKPKRNKSKKGGRGSEAEEEEDERGPRGRVTEEQSRRDRLRARREATREREKLNKQRQRERRKAAKEREKERKRRNRLRRRGIRVPRTTTPQDTSLTEVPEEETPEEEPLEEEVVVNEGPVGMISIFNRSRELGLEPGEQYGDKPDSYFLKHRPAYQEGRLWLAWTLIKRDKLEEAQLILEDMRNDRGTLADIREQGLAVQAYLYIESNNPNAAIPYLREAAEASNKRQQRARYWYIVGQLHQQLGERALAAEAFNEVVDTRPDYELQLAAALNLAQNDFMSGNGDAETALNRLERMRKEDKNAPYESQIYYATLANVALRSNDRPAGIDYLKKALASSTAGPAQRLEAYRLLGDLNYDATDYLAAKLYYDSTLSVMAESDTRYLEVSLRRDQLTDIAATLQDIALKDSLLVLANLSPEELTAKAEQILNERRQQRIRNAEVPQDGGGNTANLSGSTFWAYDSRAMRRASRDFERDFGDRALEDNWRRSRRTDASLFTAEGDAPVEEEEGPIVVTEEEVQTLFSEVPNSENDKRAMELQLSEAYFKLGRLYRDRLDDNAKAAETLEALNERYPGSNFEAESWYYLYLAHTDLGNAQRAAYYRDQLVDKYAGTNFERAITDPNFADQMNAEELQRERAYQQAYDLFVDGNYEQANNLARANQSQLLGQHPLRAKYALLMAMTTGQTQGRDAYVNALRQVVAQYTDTPEQARAREILRILGETGARLPGGVEDGIGGNFTSTPDELHYLILVFTSRNVDLNEVKIAVSEYNQEYFRSARLRITNVYLGQENDVPVLVMRRFQNGEDAMEYISTTEQNANEWLDADLLGFNMYAVSQSNYREILGARSIAGYPQFFNSEYR
ncbi:MAG: tetratricopeptide repeat protein [Bacteroidota bacterium]